MTSRRGFVRSDQAVDSALRTWGLKLKERIGHKRAAVAVARKLAVIMRHAANR
jgi:transposase